MSVHDESRMAVRQQEGVSPYVNAERRTAAESVRRVRLEREGPGPAGPAFRPGVQLDAVVAVIDIWCILLQPKQEALLFLLAQMQLIWEKQVKERLASEA